MNKIVSFILKLFVALTLGLAITGFVMQRDPHLLGIVEQKAHSIFGKTFRCVSAGKITSINLVWPTITMESVVVKSDQEPPDWYWSCRTATISFSWISVLLQRAFPLKIVLEDVRSHSLATQGKPAIADYLKRLSTPVPGGLPIFARELSLKGVVANLQDTQRPLTAMVYGAATMRKKGSQIFWNIYPADGNVWWNGQSYVAHIKGSVKLNAGTQPSCDSTLTCHLPRMQQSGKQDCFLHMSCKNAQLAASVNSGDQSLIVHMTGDVRNIPGTIRADVSVKDLVWQSIKLPAAQFTLSADQQTKQLSTGIVDLQLAPELAFTGSWAWDDKTGLSLNLSHEPWALAIAAAVSRSGDIAGTYTVAQKTTGSFKRQEQAISVDVDVSTIPNVIGKGTLAIDMMGTTGTVVLRNGTIKIAPISNYLNELTAQFSLDMSNRSATITNAKAGFHRGSVTIPQGTFFWDEKYRLQGLHLPIIAHELFASWQKEFITALSGELVLSQKQTQPAKIQGTLFLDNAQMRGMGEPRTMQSPKISGFAPIDLDVQILSRNGMLISTPDLDAKADADITVRNTTAAPELGGHIKFSSGNLKLPYKPLTISHGIISYLPGQQPLIELVAKGKVRTYHVTLRAQGSLYAPRITVDSSPQLSQDQIATLLLSPSIDVNSFNSYFRKLLRPLSQVRLVPSFIDETGRGGLRGAIEIEVSDQLSASIEKNFSLPEDTKIKIDYAISDDVSLRGIRDERGDLGSEVEFRWSR